MTDYDVIIIDAFNGDSIPVHLITTEAFKEYRPTLETQEGLSWSMWNNNYLDLIPVVASISRTINANSLASVNPERGPNLLSSKWCLLTWNEEPTNALPSKSGWRKLFSAHPNKEIRPSDRYLFQHPPVFQLKSCSILR